MGGFASGAVRTGPSAVILASRKRHLKEPVPRVPVHARRASHGTARNIFRHQRLMRARTGVYRPPSGWEPQVSSRRGRSMAVRTQTAGTRTRPSCRGRHGGPLPVVGRGSPHCRPWCYRRPSRYQFHQELVRLVDFCGATRAAPGRVPGVAGGREAAGAFVACWPVPALKSRPSNCRTRCWYAASACRSYCSAWLSRRWSFCCRPRWRSRSASCMRCASSRSSCSSWSWYPRTCPKSARSASRLSGVTVGPSCCRPGAEAAWPVLAVGTRVCRACAATAA